MRRHRQIADVLLGTGLYLLLKGRKRLADAISDNILGMVVGVGVGVGIGMLLAPKTGRETRQKISGKVHDIGSRVRDRFQAEGERATGTHGI